MVLGHEPFDRAPRAEAHHTRLDGRLDDAQRFGGLFEVAAERYGRRRCHSLQRIPVGFGIGILERPVAQQRAHLIAQRLISQNAGLGRTLLRMLRQLGQHSQQRIGHGLVCRVRHRAHDFEDRVDRESMRRVNRELESLSVVATHFDEPPQRARLERPDELGRAAPQGHRFGTTDVFQFVRDLQQISDDDLIVGSALGMVVDGFRDRARLGGGRWRIVAACRFRAERGASQTDPQLSRARAAILVLVFRRRLTVLLQQLELFVGDRVQAHVIPGAQVFGRAETERLTAPIGVDGENPQHIRYLGDAQPAVERDGAQVMAVQAAGELGEQRVFRICGDPFDHELVARDAQRERGAFFEQVLGPSGDAERRRLQRGVPLGIHRVLMEGDGKIDQEVGEFPGECGPLGRMRRGSLARGRGHGTPKIVVAPVPKLTFAKRNSPGSVPGAVFDFLCAYASVRLALIHPAHSTARHRRSLLLLLLFHHDTLGREEQARDGGGVLQGRTGDLRGVDDARRH